LAKFLTDADGYVTLERFGKIIDIFGPLSITRLGMTSFFKEDLLVEEMQGKMFDMLNRPWFHGDMTMTEAFNLLQNKDVGVFLVRFSTTTNQFVISNVVRREGGRFVIHIRVKHTPEVGFSIPGSSHPEPDLYSLLEANKKQFAIPQAPESTKYKWITTMSHSKDGGYGVEEDDVSIGW